MKRKPLLTKKERKALSPMTARSSQAAHIHCIACGVHLEPDTVRYLVCAHGTRYSSCADCVPKSKQLLEDHDRLGRPVTQAAPWHSHDHGHAH